MTTSTMSAALALIAKAPVPGRVKTRLTPPCSPQEAAALAEAALTDTLAAMRAAAPGRLVVVLDGKPGPWLTGDAEILVQRGAGLDERLANAFTDIDGPALIVGMDTPQVTPGVLQDALVALASHDAVLGPADDGGYWCIGLRVPDPFALLGVPMSTPDTCAAQRVRLGELGLTVAEVDALRDVDDMDGALAVAADAPDTHFAQCLRGLPVTA